MEILLTSNAMTYPITFSRVLCNAVIKSINFAVITSDNSYFFFDSSGFTYLIKTHPIEFLLVAKNRVRHKYKVTMIATSLKSFGCFTFFSLTNAFFRTGLVSLVFFGNLFLRNGVCGFFEYLNDMAPLPHCKPKIKVMPLAVKGKFLPIVNAFVFFIVF